jgi:c-di-GMP-binding flagellar brake protein YcgR
MLQLGDFIYLYKVNEQTNKKQKYRCKVEGINSKSISVTYPVEINTSKTEFFVDGTRFLCEFTTQAQQAFQFETLVLGRQRDQIPLLILEFPEKKHLQKIQRREFLRVDTSLDIAIHPLHNEFEPFTSIAVDISAGGSAVNLKNNYILEQGKNVLAWLALPMLSGDIVYIKVLCQVVRIIESNKNPTPRASLKFIELDEKVQQKITKYCFEQQVSNRKKGLTE